MIGSTIPLFARHDVLPIPISLLLLPLLLHRRIFPILRAVSALALLVLALIRAPTIIEVADLGTVEERFFQRLVDFVVHVAGPCCGCGAGAYLRGVFVQDLAEVAGAFTAG